MLEISRVDKSAFDLIWPMFKDIVATGDTFVYAPDITYEAALPVWFDEKFQTYIAYEVDESRQPAAHGGVPLEDARAPAQGTINKVVGAYVIRPNHRDLGNHIANAAYIVNKTARKSGIGKALAEHSFIEAKAAGYLAMQFNFVVSTNQIAVKLWQSVGFKIIGTVPEAYRHQQLKKLVDIYIMHRSLA